MPPIEATQSDRTTEPTHEPRNDPTSPLYDENRVASAVRGLVPHRRKEIQRVLEEAATARDE